MATRRTEDRPTSGRHETPAQIQSRYRERYKVSTYECKRFGNIRKSLSHYLDCDAIEQFIRQAYGQRPVRALDLACGTGRLTRTLACPDREIISVDYSDRMLAEMQGVAAQPHSPLRVVRADGFQLPFYDATFDVIFTIRFLRHFRTPDRSRLYGEIHRLLKPDGVVIFDVINGAMDHGVATRQVWDEPFTQAQITDELAAHHFSVEGLVASNIVKDPLFILLKKWSLIGPGLWYSRRIRGHQMHVDAATSWVVCARKLMTSSPG